MTFSLSLISTDNLFSRTGRAGNKGYSNTFITPEQARNAMDIIKAFELSESPVPPSLQKLWDDYKEAAKAVSRYLRSLCRLPKYGRFRGSYTSGNFI